MSNIRILVPLFVLAICSIATAQPRTISKIVGNNSISDRDAEKIQRYASVWAENLQTMNASELSIAHNKLVEPLKPDHNMSPYARSLYGKALKESFKTLLSSENEMGAINALQILSFLGTEQACGVLLSRADTATEERASLRLWASIGLGKSFQMGVLPPSRISDYATLLSKFTLKEKEWHIVVRQFDTLASLYSIPDVDNREQAILEELSMQLQTNAIVQLLGSIKKSSSADDRVKSLPFILPSLRLQLIEPSITRRVREKGQSILLPALIDFVEFSTTHAATSKDDDQLHSAYRESVNSAGLIVNRILGMEGGDVSLAELWDIGDYKSIADRVTLWKEHTKN